MTSMKSTPRSAGSLTSRRIRHTAIVVKSIVLSIALGIEASSAPGAVLTIEADDHVSEREFRSVPQSDRPWVYWWWLKGNVSEESITRDLEAMKKQGAGGFLLFDSRGYHDDYYTGNIPVPLQIKLEFMSPAWREMVKYAMREADRLDLKMSINLANTGGSLRGPWDMGAHGPKRLIWTAASIMGPAGVSVTLDKPAEKNYFWDTALLAVKVGSNAKNAAGMGPVDLNGKWYEVVDGNKGDARVADEVIDLQEHLKGNKLLWDAPEGEWRILRFACAVFEKEGHHGGTSAGQGSVDILNAAAVEKYFNHMGRGLLDDAGALAGKTLTHFYNVSWEGVYPNWTVGFAKEFKKYRGYELKPYLPVLAGMIVGDMDVSDRFMRDYHKTLSDCFRNNCYLNIGRLSHAHGIKWHSENGGPWMREAPIFKEADMLEFWGCNDVPQGEFWVDKPDPGRTNARFAAMAAHIYGRPLVSMEAFTHMDYHWSKAPAYLKPFADMNYIDGANMYIWHTFTSSPPQVGLPGYEYFAGTHINQNVTWWGMCSDFFAYLGRCQYLLRKGNYVADVCTYRSVKNYQRWGRGEQWSDDPSLKLGRGYKYDLINTDVLLNKLSCENGGLVIDNGMKYRILVIDLEDQVISPQALAKIVRLARAGAPIVLRERRPIRSPGLGGYPESDREVLRLARWLWDENAGSAAQSRPANLYANASLADVLNERAISPDFEGPYDFVHRSGSGFDIYFITGSGRAECTFRVYKRKPEFWDPVSGRIRDAVNYRVLADGRIAVPITLPENGSLFVVFRKPADENHITSITGEAEGLEIAELNNNRTELIFWSSGDFQFTTEDEVMDRSVEIPSPMELVGPWVVRFESGFGAPQETTFERLIEWNKHSNRNVRYYSGTATYHKSFTLTAEQIEYRSRLSLNRIYDIARVRLNGVDLGVVWTCPWTVDLTGVIRAGENDLQIEVANCWANRLIGDAGLPAKERHTRTNVRLVPDRREYQDFQAYSAADSLLPSGLIGPIIIEFGKVAEITL